MSAFDASTTVVVDDPDHGPIELDVHLAGPADGVPVLLLHGFPQSARSWDRVVERLAGHGLRLVAPDQRGYSPGARPAAVAAYAVPRLVADVLAVADALDTGPSTWSATTGAPRSRGRSPRGTPSGCAR